MYRIELLKGFDYIYLYYSIRGILNEKVDANLIKYMSNNMVDRTVDRVQGAISSEMFIKIEIENVSN